MPRAHDLEILLAREDELHRPARLHRQFHGDRLDVRLHLVAETGAHARRDATELRHWDAERFANIGLDAKHRLIGRPQRDPAGCVDLRERAARLERHMRLRLRGVVPLDHHLGLRPRRGVALGEIGARADVAAASGVENLEVGV